MNPPGAIVLNHSNIQFLTTVGEWTTKSPPKTSCSKQGKLVFVHIPSLRSWNHSTALSKCCFIPAKAKFSKNLLQQSWATAEWITCKSLLQEVCEPSVPALFIHRLLHEESQNEIGDPVELENEIYLILAENKWFPDNKNAPKLSKIWKQEGKKPKKRRECNSWLLFNTHDHTLSPEKVSIFPILPPYPFSQNT